MDSYVKEVCDERHRRIDRRLEELEGKTDTLEKSDAANTNEIKNLCQQIGNQTKAIWGLVTSILFVLIGFFVWYVQNVKK